MVAKRFFLVRLTQIPHMQNNKRKNAQWQSIGIFFLTLSIPLAQAHIVCKIEARTSTIHFHSISLALLMLAHVCMLNFFYRHGFDDFEFVVCFFCLFFFSLHIFSLLSFTFNIFQFFSYLPYLLAGPWSHFVPLLITFNFSVVFFPSIQLLRWTIYSIRLFVQQY